ncbi:MAG: hypothetical protein JOZ69_12840 [Myxococcales bacterium]|nr:hypothetical protein [Myxococcales bacterium]
MHEHDQHGIAANLQHDAARGMRVFIPAFAPADRHTTMISLAVPAGTGERSLASVEIRYKDRLLQRNVTRELPVDLRWAGSDAESAATEDRSLTRLAQAFGAGETILEAADRVDRGERQEARRLLDERAEILRVAAERLGEPMLAEEGARMTRMSAAVGGDHALADPLALVVLPCTACRKISTPRSLWDSDSSMSPSRRTARISGSRGTS